MLVPIQFTHHCESYHTAGVQAFTMKLISAAMTLVLCAGTSITTLAGEQNLPEFYAQYDVYRSGVKIAKTDRSFSRMQDGNLLYRSETNVTGLVSMFRQDHIIEESIWQFADGKVIPHSYEYIYSGNKDKDKNIKIAFDWKKNQITNSINGSSWYMPTTEGIVDKLLYQYSIMLDMQAGKSKLTYKVADGGKEKLYEFEALGEETIDTPLGKLKTIKIVRHFPNSTRQSIFWSAPEVGYLPVKLENVDDGVKTIVTITSLTGYGYEKVTQK